MSVRGLHFLLVDVIYAFFHWLLELIGLSFINKAWSDSLNAIDLWLANGFTSLWDRNMERKATAPMKIIEETLITPDDNIVIDRQKIGHRETVTPLECWLTDESIDYSIFFDYYIDPNVAKEALSRLLAKTPIIGGVWTQMDDHQIGIDHRSPTIPFIHATTQYVPSVNPKDAEQPYYYTKYTNGANKRMPFPEGHHVFKVTMTHYPKPNRTKSDESELSDSQSAHNRYDTLIAIGCSHALCDAEALFTLLRGWASEIRGVGDDEYVIPEFSRRRLFVDLSKEKKPPIPAHRHVLGKHFGNSCIERPSWFSSSVWPARRWKPRSWIWNKAQINALKQAAFRGNAGERLKEIGRISGNDVLLALYWKLNAMLNGEYEANRPIICSMVINTRKWIPDRFPDPKQTTYFGNALAFLVLHEQRGKLISMDFSEVVLRVRETVMKLKPEHFEEDLRFYTQWIQRHGIKYRQCFQGPFSRCDFPKVIFPKTISQKVFFSEKDLRKIFLEIVCFELQRSLGCGSNTSGVSSKSGSVRWMVAFSLFA